MNDGRVNILKQLLDRGIIKRANLEEKIAKAKKEGQDWKANQLQSRLDTLDKKQTVVWDSSKGTFKREKIILENLSVDKLKELAKKHNISGSTKMTKAVLIEELRKKGV